MAEDLPLWAQELGGVGLEEQDEFDMLRMRSGRSDSDSGLTEFASDESIEDVPDWLQDVANDTDGDTGSASSGSGSGAFNTFTAGQKLIIAILVFLIVIVFVIGLTFLF